jgi:polar amino acid transport system substrate-binding protein
MRLFLKSPLRLCVSMLWSLLVLPGLVQSTEISKLKCFSAAFEPFVIEREGSVSGIDVDVVKEAGRSLGIDVDFELMPWARLENALRDGKVDCVAAYFRTPEREAYMHFTGVPLHITAYSFFVNTGGNYSYKSIQEVNGWTVGVNRGFKTTEEFEQAILEKRIVPVEVNSTKQGFDMLRLKRLDAVLTNQHVGLYLTKQHHPGAFEALKPSMRATPAYLVFAKKEEFKQLVGRFNESLMDLMTDGRYQEIFQSYTR